jgi:ElaB/YqjD/DUF883 family membrane-anchored ribosome-binding protein
MKSNSTTPSPGALLDELRTLVADAESMIGNNAQIEADPQALGALRERFDAAQQCLTKLYGDTRKKVMAGARHTDEVVRANPYQSIAVVAGIVLLIGVLVGRRTSN